MGSFAGMRIRAESSSNSQAEEAEPIPLGNSPQMKIDRHDRYCAIAIFLVTIAYVYLFRRYTSIEPDEGIVLQGAQRILRGELLYRDFFSFFTPGSYYFLALLFKIFGSSLLVGRVALVFFAAICSTVTYLLARRVCSRKSALFAAGIATLTTLPYRFEVLHNWDSSLFACLTLYAAVRWLESRHWVWVFVTGSFASLTFLFEQSKGAGLMLGLSVGLLGVRLLHGQRYLCNGKQILVLAVGVAFPFIAEFAYFGSQHSLALMLSDWFWPLQHYSLANRVPYGYQNWSEATRHRLFGSEYVMIRVITILAVSPCFLIPLIPLIAVSLLVYWTIRMRQNSAAWEVGSYYILVCSAVSGLLVSVIVGRADILHFVYLQPILCIVLAWMIEGRDIPGKMFRVIRPYFVAYVAIAFLLLSISLLMRTTAAHYYVETRRGTITTPQKDTVVEYVQAHVRGGDAVLVYPYLPLYYYLTGTYSATRYEYFQAGMHTPEQAREMLADLKAKRVSVILFEPSFWEKIPRSWPSTPLEAFARDPVADYILREYRSCQTLHSPDDWQFLFMVRRDLPCS
jgi:4-amino-4-deoxy-L-arabinose transferase-like glycosyltransferase